MNKNILWYVCLISLFLISCKDHIDEPVIKETNLITGTVCLQNQTEHSNCLIYVDGFDVGYSSDSTGFYAVNISDFSSDFTGNLKLFYYLNDYALDSAKVEVIKGKAQTGVLDLGTRGAINTKVMKQVVLVEGWTDKYEYKVGEYFTFTVRFTNLTNDTIHLYIPSIFGYLGHIGLYRNDSLPIIFPSQVISNLDLNIYCNKEGFYEGSASYQLLNQATTNIPPNLYFVTTSIELKRPIPISKKMQGYIYEKWYLIDKGTTPKLDYAPNKYKFPLINITN